MLGTETQWSTERQFLLSSLVDSKGLETKDYATPTNIIGAINQTWSVRKSFFVSMPTQT